MPLILPHSLTIGPRGSSTPATLSAFLTSIGKASWYGNFVQGQSMTVNSDGSGGAVASGGVVGRWSPYEQTSFNYHFIQATAANRPTYGSAICTDGVGAIYGNGSSWSMSLDSTTALNQDCTVLISAETINAVTGYLFSQNGDQWAFYTNGAGRAEYYYATQVIADQQIIATSNTLSSTGNQRVRKFAMCSGTSTTRYGNVMKILTGLVSGFTTHRIRQIAFCPKLSADECAKALQYLV